MAKILHINTSGAYYDGISNVIKNIAMNNDSEENELFLIVTLEPPNEFVEEFQCYFEEIKYLQRAKKNLLNYYVQLKDYIALIDADIVHIHGNSHTTVLELLAAEQAGCKTRCVHAHNTFCNHQFFHRIATPLFNALCNVRLACGSDAGKFMFGEEKFSIINNGVDINRFSFDADKRDYIRNKYRLHSKTVVGHIGTFNIRQKNQLFLIDIIGILVKKDPSFHLMLVGDGPDREIIVEYVASKNLDNSITLVGNVADTAPYLSAMDIIVMPSIYEGLPLSLIEEQANGLQCVVSDSITKEVDKTGNVSFLSLQDSPEKWAAEVDKVPVEGRCNRASRAEKQLQNARYDIKEEVKILSLIYQNNNRER